MGMVVGRRPGKACGGQSQQQMSDMADSFVAVMGPRRRLRMGGAPARCVLFHSPSPPPVLTCLFKRPPLREAYVVRILTFLQNFENFKTFEA